MGIAVKSNGPKVQSRAIFECGQFLINPHSCNNLENIIHIHTFYTFYQPPPLATNQTKIPYPKPLKNSNKTKLR